MNKLEIVQKINTLLQRAPFNPRCANNSKEPFTLFRSTIFNIGNKKAVLLPWKKDILHYNWDNNAQFLIYKYNLPPLYFGTKKYKSVGTVVKNSLLDAVLNTGSYALEDKPYTLLFGRGCIYYKENPKAEPKLIWMYCDLIVQGTEFPRPYLWIDQDVILKNLPVFTQLKSYIPYFIDCGFQVIINYAINTNVFIEIIKPEPPLQCECLSPDIVKQVLVKSIPDLVGVD
jgi:hypothetical protein